MKTIQTKNEGIAAINSLHGKIFSVEFVKASGEKTVRNARGKDFKSLKGGESTHGGSESIPFYSNNDKGWRSFNVSRLIRITCGAQEFAGKANPVLQAKKICETKIVYTNQFAKVHKKPVKGNEAEFIAFCRDSFPNGTKETLGE